MVLDKTTFEDVEEIYKQICEAEEFHYNDEKK